MTERDRLEVECVTAFGIIKGMAETIEQIERWWPPSKRGSNAQRNLDDLKAKRDAAELCLRDGLGESL